MQLHYKARSNLYGLGKLLLLSWSSYFDLTSFIFRLRHLLTLPFILNFANNLFDYFQLATFMMHTCTFISIWSWLLMSTLRYVSVYYPFIYIRLWKLPNKVSIFSFIAIFSFNFQVLVTIIFVAVCMNSWLFISITDQQKVMSSTFI